MSNVYLYFFTSYTFLTLFTFLTSLDWGQVVKMGKACGKEWHRHTTSQYKHLSVIWYKRYNRYTL
jgi:hypothetical protein